MIKIEVHGVKPTGERYRLNEFRSENAALSGAMFSGSGKALEALRRTAKTAVRNWQPLFPDDVISVAEIELDRVRKFTDTFQG